MASSTNVRKEISRLYNVNSGITDEEFSGLLAYIVVNPNKVADIEECLKYGNDRVRLRYLRTLLSSSMFSSMLNYIILFANNNTYLFLCFSFLLLMIIKNIRVIVEQSAAGQGDFPNLDSLKNIIKEVIKDEVKDIKNDVREIKNEVTGTDKGSIVMEKGAHIGFPLVLTTSSKRSGNGRFTSPSNKNADSKEEEIQQYFINECKELERTPNIKNN
ncbi:hypothetical protein RhiirC2_712297 [Rhizophagus irregularis]|uniref:Uncharacterized protein n=1 Tax=Rhizophagus irregularis TaxID=588596 RepID=A0A2N1N7T7_9GLOM|nr:hypothetical protein RhiirC2_712297 [Rhizophagus irregularis]